MATKPTKAQGASAKDLLSGLTAGKKATPKKADTKANRPELELSPALEQAFINFAAADALAEEVNSRIEREKDFLNDGCFQTWTKRLWKAKNRPANPALEVEKNGQPDIQGIYQVQERYTLNLPEVPDGKSLEKAVAEKLTDLFVATGMGQKEAEKKAAELVANELVLTPKPILDLDRLVNGHWEGEGKNKTFVEASAAEQLIATKVIRLMNARSVEDIQAVADEIGLLTDEEQEAALEYKPQLKVKPQFLSRVCNYVNSLEQLRVVFSIIKPVRFPQAKKFAASDTPEERNRRLLSTACDILGVALS
jgi:hypothetical protein